MVLNPLEWIGGWKRKTNSWREHRSKAKCAQEDGDINRVCTDINRATATECAFAWLSHPRLLGRAATLDGDLTPLLLLIIVVGLCVGLNRVFMHICSLSGSSGLCSHTCLIIVGESRLLSPTQSVLLRC